MSAPVMTVVELADLKLGVGTVVGLTTTELPAALIVGLDGGGDGNRNRRQLNWRRGYWRLSVLRARGP